ncbi:hypothetical protein KY5_6485c [Streptomyces formicae]|uniref:Uncharacterized protein n=1 Tax=Streptomyces formicae TaxID=1616117 RepID=A0A291QJ71_9ACTN|nr:hypothetical protein KY5_6485c [Streptomyces formicae]
MRDRRLTASAHAAGRIEWEVSVDSVAIRAVELGEVAQPLRSRAAADHQLVVDHIDRYGEPSAQRLFTRAFVAQVQRLADLGHLNLGCATWERR